MKKINLFFIIIGLAVITLAFTYPAEKLLDPAKFAALLKNPAAKKPVILNVGPSPNLPGAKTIGNASDPVIKEDLKKALKTIPKNQEIVIYCGCCELDKCYNIHEADKVLTSLGYTNFKILNMPKDFDTDWKSKNYPVE